MTRYALLEIAYELISRHSVTPNDAGCQDFLADHLESLDFDVERVPSGGASNFWARRGAAAPVFAFAGHTDVVPPGPEDKWTGHPFVPEIRDGWLYGRGAADMKGSLAAMMMATERFLAAHPTPRGSLAFLVTSAEECMFEHGTPRVVERLEERGEKIDWCLVGEPTSAARLGDTVKNGRRGSLSGRLVINGQQGHVAYPQQADNAVHRALPALAELVDTSWCEGNEHFPPTGFQISNVRAGTGADNVIPGECEVAFNSRYSTEWTEADLKARVVGILERHELDFYLTWTAIGEPFLTAAGELLAAVEKAVAAVAGAVPELSTSGGTSDGRFIAPTGAQVVELGPRNATIHKVNECVAVEDLEGLEEMYLRILTELLT